MAVWAVLLIFLIFWGGEQFWMRGASAVEILAGVILWRNFLKECLRFDGDLLRKNFGCFSSATAYTYTPSLTTANNPHNHLGFSSLTSTIAILFRTEKLFVKRCFNKLFRGFQNNYVQGARKFAHVKISIRIKYNLLTEPPHLDFHLRQNRLYQQQNTSKTNTFLSSSLAQKKTFQKKIHKTQEILSYKKSCKFVKKRGKIHDPAANLTEKKGFYYATNFTLKVMTPSQIISTQDLFKIESDGKAMITDKSI